MDSYDFNKFAGAALAALLLVFGGSVLIDIARGSHKVEGGFKLPEVKTTAGGAAPVAAAFSFAKVVELLPKASVESGQAAFKKCATCHTPDKGGKHGQGPNLWGVVGRKKGGVDGFAFSNAVKDKGGEWSYEHLVGYINAPAQWLPGNKMAFAGVKDPAEMADVLAYLRTLADSPAPLPK
jgi:cytochrome c